MLLGAQQVSIVSLLRSIYDETVCEKCPGTACECSNKDCDCGNIGCGVYAFGQCNICQSTVCLQGCHSKCKYCQRSDVYRCHAHRLQECVQCDDLVCMDGHEAIHCASCDDLLWHELR
jgi:hypothetical protein